MNDWQRLGPVALRLAVDAISARLHTGPYPATAPVLSILPRNPKLSRNSRAVSAHRKDSHNG